MTKIVKPSPEIRPGIFIRPSGAQLRSVAGEEEESEQALQCIWEEVKPFCWVYPKPDGWRLQIHKRGEEVMLYSRSGKDWTDTYQAIKQLIQSTVEIDQAILDVELVGFDDFGRHLEPTRLREADNYRCYLLDALYLNGTDLTSLSTKERLSFIREQLSNTFHDIFTLVEYTLVESLDELKGYYRLCQLRRKEGFDGAIIKKPTTPYFTDVLKIKPEDTVDTVIVGAYEDKQGEIKSLLLAVPDTESHCWIPIARVTKKSIGNWSAIWSACTPHIVDHQPDTLVEMHEMPDIWIAPKVVAQVTLTEFHRGKVYTIRAEYARKCILREDKGPEEATPFQQALQMAGLTRQTEMPAPKPKRSVKLKSNLEQEQLSLFTNP